MLAEIRGIETVWVELPDAAWAEEIFSGWFDSPLLPFPPQRAKIARVGGAASQAQGRSGCAHHDKMKTAFIKLRHYPDFDACTLRTYSERYVKSSGQRVCCVA